MKKMLNALLAAVLSISICGCSSDSAEEENETADPAAQIEEEPEEKETVVQEEELIDDPAWETLNSLGKVETENGLFFVTVTLPADLAGDDITQESIDAAAGETYTSGKLNDDGSVTYKMTKRQHKNMLDTLRAGLDETLKEMCESDEYAFSQITHNDDFTSFDVKLTTEELGLSESFMVMAFYMYGGMYSIFTGKQSDVIVNFYSADGQLIETANSANIGG